MVDSPLGKIPQGWKVKPVAEAFQILGGSTTSKKVREYWQDGSINWYTPSDLTAAKSMFIERCSDPITESGLKNTSARMFAAMSVMLTSRATIGAIPENAA
jgi:type I restriction enzyme, S subunit